MKVILDYDEATGFVCDANGTMICTWVGLQHFGEDIPTDPKIDSIMKLRTGGFTADEIKMLIGD